MNTLSRPCESGNFFAQCDESDVGQVCNLFVMSAGRTKVRMKVAGMR